MDTNFNASESFNELVFENRNKDYGAYVLRRSQGNTITQSLLITCSFFGILMLIGFLFSDNAIQIPVIEKVNDPGVIVTVVDLPHPTPDPVIKPKIDPPVKPASTAGPVTGPPEVTDRTVEGPVKPAGDVTSSSTSTTSGPATDVDNHGSPTPNPGPDLGALTNTTVIPKVVEVPDKMPEFKDLNKFIVRHIKLPESQIGRGISGVVFITFVVEPDGSVSDVKLKSGIGKKDYEDEAIRVVKLMSGWTPGIYGGKAVRVQCTLPIRFSVAE